MAGICCEKGTAMMGRLFDNPWAVLVLVVLAVVLFGAARLPGIARGLGQSMRILKSEVKEMKHDGKAGSPDSSGSPEPPIEGRVMDAAGETRPWKPEGPKGQ
jgi:sec-independent protein translocase protein TatA